MTTINYRSKVGGALLVLSLLFGIALMSSMTAQAQDSNQDSNNDQWHRRDRNRSDNQDQDRDWRRNRNGKQDRDVNRARSDDRYNRDNRQVNNGAYNNGRYNNGTYNNGRYNNGGYNNGGYNNGGYTGGGRGRSRYGRNWDGYPNWGGTFDLRQTALNAGYNEGARLGRDDRSRNRYSDYSRSSAYRNGTKDYSSRLGDRELYRRYFREAFQNGYSDGFNGY